MYDHTGISLWKCTGGKSPDIVKNTFRPKLSRKHLSRKRLDQLEIFETFRVRSISRADTANVVPAQLLALCRSATAQLLTSCRARVQKSHL